MPGDILMAVDIDLDSLKREILEYLDASGFAVFRSFAGGLEGLPMVGWDADAYPDYRMFLDTAKKVNSNLILLASTQFDAADEVDGQLEELEDCEITREDRREYERRLREYRVHDGNTATIELGFDHNGRLYVYEVAADWYEEFMELAEELTSLLPATSEDDESGMGGFYSNN